jgi:hypothetical protein
MFLPAIPFVSLVFIIIIQHSRSLGISIPCSFHFASWRTDLGFILHTNYGLTPHLKCIRNGRPRCGICSCLTFRWGHVSHTHKAVRDFHSLTHKKSLHKTLTTLTFGSLWATEPMSLSSKFLSFQATNEIYCPGNHPFSLWIARCLQYPTISVENLVFLFFSSNYIWYFANSPALKHRSVIFI